MESRTSSSTAWKRPSAPRTCSPATDSFPEGALIFPIFPMSCPRKRASRDSGARERRELPDRLEPVVGLERPGKGASVRKLARLVVLLHRFHERPAVDFHDGLAALGELARESSLDIDDLGGRARRGLLVYRFEDLPVGLRQ